MLQAFVFPKSKVIEDLKKLPALPMAMIPPSDGGGNPYFTGEVIRLLFLDIDGVVTSHKVQIVHGTLASGKHDHELKKAVVKNPEAVDLMAIGLINKLCEHTDTHIVISSSWRIGFTLQQVQSMMDQIGINSDLVIGMTDTKGACRGNEIARFLEKIQTPEGILEMTDAGHLDKLFLNFEVVKVGAYVIIEDDVSSLLPSQSKNIIATTFMEGLGCEQTIEAGKILTNDETFYLNRLGGEDSVGEKKGFCWN